MTRNEANGPRLLADMTRDEAILQVVSDYIGNKVIDRLKSECEAMGIFENDLNQVLLHYLDTTPYTDKQ